MSALEVIRLIQELPQADRREVFEFMQQFESEGVAEPVARYASVDQVKGIAGKVFDTNEELFRKLAK